MRTPIAFALLFALLADANPPRQPPRPEERPKPDQQIKIRQGSELFMSWNMNRINDMVADRAPNYDKEAVVKAAQAVAAVANAGLGSLYGPGTDKAVGDAKTRVKAEFFQQPDKVKELMGNFAAQANELARVAEAGEPAAIRQQLGKTSETCKACHESFRID